MVSYAVVLVEQVAGRSKLPDVASRQTLTIYETLILQLFSLFVIMQSEHNNSMLPQYTLWLIS